MYGGTDRIGQTIFLCLFLAEDIRPTYVRPTQSCWNVEEVCNVQYLIVENVEW